MSDLPRLVFVGDSITDAGRDRADPGSLGAGYVSLIAEALVGEASVVNAGVSGDRAVDLLARWQADVEPTRPDVLTVYVGVNDTWRRFDSGDPTSPQQFEATYRRLLDSTAARHARLVLVEPYLLPLTADQEAWLEDLAGKRAVVRALADEYGATLVDLPTLFGAEAERATPEAMTADGVHPSPLGAQVIADAWLAAYRR